MPEDLFVHRLQDGGDVAHGEGRVGALDQLPVAACKAAHGTLLVVATGLGAAANYHTPSSGHPTRNRCTPHGLQPILSGFLLLNNFNLAKSQAMGLEFPKRKS